MEEGKIANWGRTTKMMMMMRRRRSMEGQNCSKGKALRAFCNKYSTAIYGEEASSKSRVTSHTRINGKTNRVTERREFQAKNLIRNSDNFLYAL